MAQAEEGSSGGVSALRWPGLVGGPIVGLAVYVLLRAMWGGAGDTATGGMSESACRVAGVAVWMGIWWLTEALPLAATALLPIALFPLLKIMPVKSAAAPFGDDLIFLFLGGFLLQLAMERWGLHRRIALVIILAVGTRPTRMVGGIMLATALLSMWISNAASSAMMLPIGMSVCQLVASRSGHGHAGVPSHPDPLVRNLGRCVMIGIAWSATIGGISTPIGTAPNVLLRGYLTNHGVPSPTFAQWMMLCGPMAAGFLVLAWVLLTRVFFPISERGAAAARVSSTERAMLLEELRGLGPIKVAEWATMSVFAMAVTGWLFGEPISRALGLVRTVGVGDAARTVPYITDSVVAITAGILVFAIPVNIRKQEFVLDWRSAMRVPYGVLLLFGGGLALAEGIQATGLDRDIGRALQGIGGMHPLVIILIVTGVTVFLSEFMSNTALTATLLPIMGSVAVVLGVEPATLLVPLALGASCAFMMPAGTPPSAITFSSGYYSIRDMAKAGLVVDLIGTGLIAVMVYTGLEMVMRW